MMAPSEIVILGCGIRNPALDGRLLYRELNSVIEQMSHLIN
jgi:hypothetical protein